MRRVLLGSFALTLGVITPSAFAQQPAHATDPPARAARLGRPVAIPNTPAQSDPEVTPAGLIRGVPARPTVTYAPGANFGSPLPVVAQPAGVPMAAQPMPMTQPMTQGGAAPPMVTESRDSAGQIPGGVVVPPAVPPVGPDVYAGPVPDLEDPLYGGCCPTDRLRGCGRSWVSAELLLWWSKTPQVPALVTTSAPQFNGIPGQGNTAVLLGGTFGDSFRAGGRVGAGHWFDDCQTRGVEGRLFWLAPATSSFTATAPPYALLARPFFNVNPTVGLPNVGYGPSAEVVAGPGVATGKVAATLESTVWGAEVNYLRHLAGDGCARLDLLAGYRYLRLSDDLSITESFTRVPGSDASVGVPAVAGVIGDRFQTTNNFHGGQVGLVGTIQRGRWSLDGRTSVALGTVFQSADISGGQTLVYPNGGVQTVPGGLLAVPGANIGHWSQSKFAVVPEVGVNLGYQLTSHMKVFVGYNFLYLSSAVRAGEVVDPYIDAARVPNLLPPGTAAPVAARPEPRLSTSGYFVQGINFGLVYRW